MITVSELVEEIRQAMANEQFALQEFRGKNKATAEAEREYVRVKQSTFLRATGTDSAKKASSELASADAKMELHVARGLEAAAMEAIRIARTDVTAWQTITSAMKEEAKLAGTGPDSW